MGLLLLPEVGVLPLDFSDTLVAALSTSSPKTLLTAAEYFPLPLDFASLLLIDCNGDGARIGDAARVVAVAAAVVGFTTLADDGDRVLLGCTLLGDGDDARETRCCSFILDDGDVDSVGVLGGDADILLVTGVGLSGCCCF